MHAIVARSTFRSQKREKTNGLGPLLEVEMSKQSARGCGAKHISKSILLKTDGLGPPLSDRFWNLRCGKKCTPLWRGARFEIKSVNWRSRTAFGSWDVEKSACRCGGKHVSKPKVLKTDGLGPPRTAFGTWDVEMFKKCTPLWQETHFEVKSVKKWRSRPAFGI